jgi:antitoxin Phd
LEDAEDVTAFDEAMAEEGENIPWAQVKADLGWQ